MYRVPRDCRLHQPYAYSFCHIYAHAQRGAFSHTDRVGYANAYSHVGAFCHTYGDTCFNARTDVAMTLRIRDTLWQATVAAEGELQEKRLAALFVVPSPQVTRRRFLCAGADTS